jgi:broad specificity phosphatase PhoE
MSDLQCAATLLLVAHGEDPEARRLGRSLRAARLAAIYAGDGPQVTRTAGLVGAETAAPVTVLPGLGDGARLASELETIADLHRGETVLVVSHAGAIRTGVPPLVGLPDEAAASLRLGHCTVVEVAADADGWVLRHWPGDQGMGTGPDTWTEMRDSDPV